MNQSTIFDMLYPKYKITKPIRLIEFFAGYGSQALALKYLGVEFEHWKICEWAVKSIQAYKDIHFTDDKTNYSLGIALEDLKDVLFRYGISSNYNEPMTQQQINRLNELQLRNIFNNIVATHNLVNIQQTKAKELQIVDTDKYDYILTYSFPCQDLSLAGKGKGMSDTSTRSGMLWEVERILIECKELGTMPQILLMENVTQVHGTDNVQDFNKWQLKLEELGYKNYWQDLIATDYGIPQTRNRCFMISILGDYNYTFPKPVLLRLKLKDMLEDEVDEKYYLSNKTINFFYKNEKKQKEKGNGFKFGVTDGKGIAKTITTRAGSRMDDNFICNNALSQTLKNNDINKIEDVAYIDSYNKKIRNDNLSSTITTRVSDSNNSFLLIKNDSNMKTKLCNDLIQQGKVKENDVIRHSYTTSRMKGEMKDLKQNNISPTLYTRCDCLGVVNNMRIRKLTPKECFRLMGVKDKNYENCAKNQSDSSLYHLAGDSIVVNVLMAIFKELL